jgi:hypothetical protein
MSLSILHNYNYSALVTLGGMCFSIRLTYPIVDSYLQRFEKYNNLPLERRNYIIKNFIKSVLLMLLAIAFMKPLILPIIFNDKWDNRLVHISGAIYTSNDLMGLILVKNLPYSTRMHHMITTTLCLTSFGINFQNSHLGKMIFVYTFASAHAYLVNFYLGARLLTEKKRLEIVRIMARNIYFVCCFVNWGWHLLFIFNNYQQINMGQIMYFILLFWIIKDDIILLSWLNNTMIRF